MLMLYFIPEELLLACWWKSIYKSANKIIKKMISYYWILSGTLAKNGMINLESSGYWSYVALCVHSTIGIPKVSTIPISYKNSTDWLHT